MYSLKWNIFLNKVIAPGEAGSNNLQTKFKLNTKLSLYSLYCANAYICECRCVAYRVTTLQK